MNNSIDKRKQKRYSVEGIHGNVLYSFDLEIINISIDGAAIETSKRLELNREYTFKIQYKDSSLNLKGIVVWANLISKEKTDTQTVIPVYRAGIKFIDTLSEKAALLLKFIEENRMETSESRIGVRSKIAKPVVVKIDLPHKYKVKKLSLSGMLIEIESPLDIDSHYTIELFLNETPVNIIGRVANCTKIDSPDSPHYEIGIELTEISDNDREFLKDFLNTLKKTV